jgi:DNA (cytosine-5)-methyltransferase 1
VFSFIDLFSGIGGIRIAFEQVGGHCVFSSEYDKHSQKTYETYFGESPTFANILNVDPPGDITKLPPNLVPPHDVLTAGFPCQPFSLAGVSKKQYLGKPHGFNDPTQGTLFFNIKTILQTKKPKAFFLENVKNLITHDHNKTFNIILETLDDVGYTVFANVIDAAGWLPQHRERIYIIGFRKPDNNQRWSIDDFSEFMEFPPPKKKALNLIDILEKSVPDLYTLGPGTWEALIRHKNHHKAIGQGFGYGIIEPPFNGKITRTLSARYYKDGAEILIAQKGKRPRRLTPLECSRLMGFPKDFQKLFERSAEFPQPVSDAQAYRQFGNSVAVPVVNDIAKIMIRKMVEVGALNES